MFALISHYLKPLAEVDRVAPEHREWLGRQVQAGRMILAGRQDPPVGGVLIATGSDRAAVLAMLDGDPYVREAVAQYEVVAFAERSMHPVLAELLEQLG